MRIIVVTVVMAAYAISAQSGRSPLEFRVSTAEYFGESYVERPTRSYFIFFRGEPIKLRLTINCAAMDDELVLSSVEPADIFSVTMVRDGALVPVPLSFDSLNWQGRDGRATPFRLVDRVRLNPGEALLWSAEVPSEFEPGVYQLNFVVSATDGHARKVIPYVSEFTFEIKARTRAYQPEILRRAALRRLLEEDNQGLAGAEATVNELLRIHPTSAQAHIIRSRIANARGWSDSARAHLMKALEILEADEDTVLRRFNSPEQLAEMKKRLTVSVRK